MISVSVIFDTVKTHSCSSNKGYFFNLEYKMFSRNIKGVAKVLEIYGSVIFDCSIRSEIGHVIALQDQSYYVPGLPNYSYIIYPQGICTPEGFKGTLIAHFRYDHDSYKDLNLKDYNPGWYEDKLVENFTSSMPQTTTFQLTNILFLPRYIMRSSH